MVIGDVVKLKSGGPLMTVSSIQETSITCTWFDAMKRVYTDTPNVVSFHPNTLMMINIPAKNNFVCPLTGIVH